MAELTVKTEGRISHLVTRAGKEITIAADEVIFPENELGLVRFKRDGELVGLAFANQCATWCVEPAQGE